MKPILNIENLTKFMANVKSNKRHTEWDHLPGDAGEFLALWEAVVPVTTLSTVLQL